MTCDEIKSYDDVFNLNSDETKMICRIILVNLDPANFNNTVTETITRYTGTSYNCIMETVIAIKKYYRELNCREKEREIINIFLALMIDLEIVPKISIHKLMEEFNSCATIEECYEYTIDLMKKYFRVDLKREDKNDKQL